MDLNPQLDYMVEITEQDYQNQMFQNPVYSKDSQLVKINHIFDEHGKPHQQYQLVFYVTDQMTIKQLKTLYCQQQKLENSDVYNTQTTKIVYELDFALDDDLTIREFKSKINATRLFGQFLLRLYDQTDPFFIKLQSALDYTNFQQKYSGTAEITIKLEEFGRYIYMDRPFLEKIGELKIAFLEQLIQKQGIKLKKNQNLIFKKQIKNQKEGNKATKINQQQKTYKIFTKNQDQIKTRELISLGQIIIVQSKGSELLNIQKCPFNKNLSLQIQIYTGYTNTASAQKPNGNSLNQKKESIKFKILYQNVRSMKLKTLLEEQNISNFLQISLISQNFCVLKPIDPLKNIQKHYKYFQGNVIKFQGITENFLFYKQVRNFSKIKAVDPKALLDLMMTQKGTKIDKNNRQKFQRKVEQRYQQIKEENFKEKNFLHPIVLYTSPLIYSQFNVFSRETSPSLFDSQTMTQKFGWQYPFSQKLIKSLQKIPNFKGLPLWRGMKGIKFQHQQGQIIQFNSFTSTSKNQKVARAFLSGNLKVLLKIQAFSGKQIKKFSYYQMQDQVLLFPYTKFKVIKSKLIDNIRQIHLLQIPVPKKIPGDIVVWIDANMNQNYQTFNKICHHNNIKNLQIIQLQSNQHLQIWIKQYKGILKIPNVRLHYITNLNRSKDRLGQGVQTLKIIRQLSKESQVVFYIGDIKRTLQVLNTKGHGKDQFIRVIAHPKDLNDIISSWKRNIQ